MMSLHQMRRINANHFHQVSRLLCQPFASTALETPPLSIGFLAGLQASSSDNEWSTFEEAYDILKQVDPSVLSDFESELWEEHQMKFIHSTKTISVIDSFSATGDEDNKRTITRSLVFNDRPKLIQSSIEVEYNNKKNCEHKILWQNPPPLVGLTSTHLGGLALSVPLWRMAVAASAKPNVVVVGAGGCTVPSFLGGAAGCHVTAIEANEEVRQAALKYFGAAESGIQLLPGYGEEYFKTLNVEKIDILIIDAEDGHSAPPESMKQESFWNDVASTLKNLDSVVAVNVIAHQNERIEFEKLVSDALPNHFVWCCEIPQIAQVSSRHCILFATPAREPFMIPRLEETMKEFKYVDQPRDWISEVEIGIQKHKV